MKDKTRFATAWTYAMEYVKDYPDQVKMQRHIVNAFLSSPIVTEINKTNLINLILKITDNKIKED
jgi:hypothetical protein